MASSPLPSPSASPSPTPSDDGITSPSEPQDPALTSSVLEERLHFLREEERRIEEQTAREYGRLRELRTAPTSRVLRLRIKTIHTAAEATSFDLRVQGEVLPSPLAVEAHPPKMSTLLEKVCVHLDEEQFGKDSLVEWEPSHYLTEFDGFQLKRNAKQDFQAKIELHLYRHLLPVQPRDLPGNSAQVGLSARFRTEKLQPIAGAPTATLGEVLAKLWEYINAQRLRERESNVVRNDAVLAEIFGVREMRMHELRRRVLDLLPNPDTAAYDPALVSIPYRVCLHAADAEEFAYDIEVPVADRVSGSLSRQMDAATASPGYVKKITQLDEQLAAVQTSLTDAKRKRDLACRVMLDPQRMLTDQLAASVTRDQQLLSAMTSAGDFALLTATGQWHTMSTQSKNLYDTMLSASAKRSKHWAGRWVDEGVAAMIQKDATSSAESTT
jgi:hypothetical protein